MTFCPRCGSPNAEVLDSCARCAAALPRSRSPLKATLLAALAGGMIVASGVVLAITLAVHSATPDPAPPRAAGQTTAERPQTEAPIARTPAASTKPEGLLADPPTTETAHDVPASPGGQVSAPVNRTEVVADSVEETVYITRTGEKYHRGGCRYLRQSRIPMKLSEAKRLYSPCSVCRPPA